MSRFTPDEVALIRDMAAAGPTDAGMARLNETISDQWKRARACHAADAIRDGKAVLTDDGAVRFREPPDPGPGSRATETTR